MADIEPIYKRFGARLHKLRNEADLTQSELAERVGIQRTSITNLEAGNQRLPLHVLYNLAAALGVDPGELLPAAKAEQSSVPAALESLLEGKDDDIRSAVVRLISETSGNRGDE